MDWKEEMLEAMKMMKSACAKNNVWMGCVDCPFDLYCDYLSAGAEQLSHNKKEFLLPSEFEIPESV